MNDAFLPGNGFDTYEEQDRVLMGLSGSVRSGVAVRILQQQGFAVAAAVVRLADTPEEHAAVDAAKALAKKLDVECVTLNAEALAGQDAEAARFAALLTAADKLGIQYIASGRYACIETDAQGMSHLFAPESGAPDESGKLAALPPEILSRLVQVRVHLIEFRHDVEDNVGHIKGDMRDDQRNKAEFEVHSCGEEYEQ